MKGDRIPNGMIPKQRRTLSKKMTDKYVAEVDKAAANKEAEIMEI